MNGVNLIPAARRARMRGRRLLRNWAYAGAAYVLLATAGFGWYRATHTEGTATIDAGITEADARIKAAESAIALQRRDVARLESIVSANAAVGEQPDWSLMLVLLASHLKGDAVLQTCRLAPMAEQPSARVASADGAAPPPPPPGGSVLTVSGLGKSQRAVSDYLLALETSGVFEQVKLLETSRTDFLGGEAVAFKLECSLRDARGGGR